MALLTARAGGALLSQCKRVTDRRTNRQTERINMARPRLHSYNDDIIIINLNKKYGQMFLPFCHNARV